MAFSCKKILFGIFLCGIAVCLLNCAASRKVQAASILRQCKLELRGASFDSAQVHLEKFSGGSLGGIVPNPKMILLIQNIAKGMLPDSLGVLYFSLETKVQNPSTDTIWLRSAHGEAKLNSLAALPFDWKDSALAISPGETDLQLHSHLEIGKNLLQILSADTLRIRGDLVFALSPDGEPIPFSVNQEKIIRPEERTAFVDKIRTEILSRLIESWAATLNR